MPCLLRFSYGSLWLGTQLVTTELTTSWFRVVCHSFREALFNLCWCWHLGMSICGSSREALYFSGKIPIIKPLEMYIPEIRQMDTPKSLFFRCVVYLFYINICLCNIYIYVYICICNIYIYIYIICHVHNSYLLSNHHFCRAVFFAASNLSAWIPGSFWQLTSQLIA